MSLRDNRTSASASAKSATAEPEEQPYEGQDQDEEDPVDYEGYLEAGDQEDPSAVLAQILKETFTYQHGDGSTLNIADILLLVKQSIDQNTAALQKLCERKAAAKN